MAVADKPRPKGDLAVRTVSGVVMVAVAGLAYWFGGYAWAALVVAGGIGVLFEWRVLALLGHQPGVARALWTLFGLVYVGLAVWTAIQWRDDPAAGPWEFLSIIGAVVATDVGAYLVGRAIGGPKIAPRISPSKTWSGLVGGMVGATSVFVAVFFYQYMHDVDIFASGAGAPFVPPGTANFHWGTGIFGGVLLAVVAQGGDFFESWMKRRAGVKDSGRIIPGHGGLFDRLDGLLAVLFLFGVLNLMATRL